MKPIVLIDLEAIYQLYCDNQPGLKHSNLVKNIGDYLERQGLAEYELKFFSHPEAIVLGEGHDGEYRCIMLTMLAEDRKIRVAKRQEIGVSALLKLEQVGDYIERSQALSLVISPSEKFLATVPSKSLKLKLSELGELELPQFDFLEKLNGSIHLHYDTDDTIFLRFWTYVTGELVLNPFLKDFLGSALGKHRSEICSVSFQQITSRIQKYDSALTQSEAGCEWVHRFSSNCVGDVIVKAMQAWFVEQGVAEEELVTYDILYTDAVLKLEKLYGKYQQIPAGERPLHLILFDDNYEEIASDDASAFRQRFQEELQVTVHLVRVRQQGELLPGWEQVLTNFARCSAVEAEKSVGRQAKKMYRLFKASALAKLFPIQEEDEALDSSPNLAQ